MKAGFSNLYTLKQHLLAPALQEKDTYDIQLTDLGLGIAGLIEKFCGRDFSYLDGAVEIFPADHAEFILRRTPLYAVTGWSVKPNEKDGWIVRALADIRFINLPDGIVNPHDHDVGPWHHQVQFTYTGGYWWQLAEPDDDDYTGENDPPSGIKQLPAEVKMAWLLQCKHVWQTIDPRGEKIIAQAKEGRAVPQQVFGDLDLIPQVKAMLQNFIRYRLV